MLLLFAFLLLFDRARISVRAARTHLARSQTHSHILPLRVAPLQSAPLFNPALNPSFPYVTHYPYRRVRPESLPAHTVRLHPGGGA